MRGSWIRLSVIASCVLGSAHANALPPPSVALAQGSLGGRWVQHFVIPGERLAEIAERYAVEVAKIIEWNSLDSDKPMLRVGQTLRVLSRTSASPRKRERYKVREGDNWSKIARHFDVDVNKLQKQWNPGMGDLRPGDHVIVWIEREPPPELDASRVSEPAADPVAAKLAAVVEPTHGSKPELAATLAAVVEPKAASPAPQLRNTSSANSTAAKPSPVKSSSGAPAPAPAVKASAPGKSPSPATAMAAVVQPSVATSSKPAPATIKPTAPAAKPAPSTSKPESSKPASSKPAGTTAALAMVVQPSPSKATASTPAKSAAPAPSGPPPKLVPGQVTKVGQFALVPVRAGGQSMGSPNRGRLRDGVQLPENTPLYTIRNPDHSWGSSHAVEQLQVAMAIFRLQTGFNRDITICDMSTHNGGRFRPHHSHTSGRDVDIRLPLKAGVPPDTIPENPAVVDWDMAWALVKALVATGEVQYVFLARSRMIPLYHAAQRAGESDEDLTVLIQYPGFGRNTLVRHSAGHTKHIHVRWKCAADEAQCLE